MTPPPPPLLPVFYSRLSRWQSVWFTIFAHAPSTFPDISALLWHVPHCYVVIHKMIEQIMTFYLQNVIEEWRHVSNVHWTLSIQGEITQIRRNNWGTDRRQSEKVFPLSVWILSMTWQAMHDSPWFSIGHTCRSNKKPWHGDVHVLGVSALEYFYLFFLDIVKFSRYSIL